MSDILPAWYVSLAAARQYAAARGIPPGEIESARRELTERMLDARKQTNGAWRARSRTTQIDITARAVQEGRLLIVTTVHVRDYL